MTEDLMTEEQLKAIVDDFMRRLLAECSPPEAAWIVKELLAGISFCSGASNENVRKQINIVAQMAIDTHAEMRAAKPHGKNTPRA